MGPQDFRRIVLAHELVCSKEKEPVGKTRETSSRDQEQADKADARIEQERGA
jgi:hypothetical protein